MKDWWFLEEVLFGRSCLVDVGGALTKTNTMESLTKMMGRDKNEKMRAKC